MAPSNTSEMGWHAIELGWNVRVFARHPHAFVDHAIQSPERSTSKGKAWEILMETTALQKGCARRTFVQFSSNRKMPSILYETTGSPKPSTQGDWHSAEINGNTNRDHDQFQLRSNPQQDVLLLHGPGQKYSLHKTGRIPELRSEREILIQVH